MCPSPLDGSHTQPIMGDAEAGDALPGQAAMESADAREKAADGEDLKADGSHDVPAVNTAIEDEATLGERQLDSETPDAADNEDGDGLDATKMNIGIDEEQDQKGKADARGTTAADGDEVADGGVENDDMYRRVRELALEAINAVSCCVLLVREQYSDILTQLRIAPSQRGTCVGVMCVVMRCDRSTM